MKLTSRLQTRILLALNFGILLALVVWAVGSLQADQDTLPTTHEEVAERPPIPQQSIQKEFIEAHPLFIATRMPVAVEATPDQSESVPTRPPPLLVGILKGADGRIGGLMEEPQSGSRKYVRDGEEFMGWTLMSMRSKTAVMRAGSREAEVQLSFNSRSPQNTGNSGSNPKNP